MERTPDPTCAQERWIYSLEGLYNRPEPSPSERKQAERTIASNEIPLSEKEDFAIVASYLLHERGRWRAL